MNDSVDQGAAPDAPLAGVAVYTMFRGERSQLLQWCNHHLNAGADRLYVVLDRPPQGMAETLPVHDRIHWEVLDQETCDLFYPAGRQNVERKQVDAFRWMAHRASADGHDFLAFVDTDELIALEQRFTDISAPFPHAPAFTLPVKEMWFAEDDSISDPFGATLGLSGSSARGLNWERALGWRAQFLRNGFLGHDAGKTVYRLPMPSGDITVHRPRAGSLAAATVELPPDAAALLHYDCGSVRTWNAKWAARLDGGTVATGLGPQRRAQQHLFSHTLQQPAQDQERFFREFYTLKPEAQQLLEGHGLLARVPMHETVSGPLPVQSTAADEGLRRLPLAAERVDHQFAMVCDQRFVKPTFATMASVLAQIGDKGSVRFVVLGDGLSPEDGAHLRTLEHTGHDVQVVVHDITSDLDRDVGTEDTKRATFGRIYLIDYLPEQRTVYLDGDVLATRDFTELFRLDLGNACLAGAPDSAALRLVANPRGVPTQQGNRLNGITDGDPLDYLNGGVLIFDLDNPDFRELALQARALVVLQGRALKQRDQDATNIAFKGRKFRLDSTYNYMTQFYVSDRCLDGDLVQRKYAAADASLIHFSGKIKPWESPDDEFYNGLYRRLVAEAERKLGVSCGFYFSKPALPPRDTWTPDRWVDTLAARAAPQPSRPVEDVSLLELCDDGAYLRLSSEMHELALAAQLRMSVHADGAHLLDVPLADLGPAQAHLGRRVGAGVRLLPVDLAGALKGRGGVARRVEVTLSRADEGSPGEFARSIASVDVVATGETSGSALLLEAGVDGALEACAEGQLSGWFRSRTASSGEMVSLYIDGELVARRPAELETDETASEARVRGFRFNLAHLLSLGYGDRAGAREVSVRVSGTNIPLRGSPLRVTDPDAELRYDATADAWTTPQRERRPLMPRVRRRLGGVVRRVRASVPHGGNG